jgi:histidinol dehydrogenase
MPTLSRAEVIGKSLAARGAMIAAQDLAEACEIANRVAPEHLQLSLREPDAWLDAVRHAGAVFVGSWSAEVLGDYSAGPSHVLPTFGTARYASVLSVADFQKRSSIIRAHRNGMTELGRLAVKLAEAEGLTAHAAAAQVRLQEHNADV